MSLQGTKARALNILISMFYGEMFYGKMSPRSHMAKYLRLNVIQRNLIRRNVESVPSDAEVKPGPCPVELIAKGQTMAITGEVWLRLKLQGEFFKLKATVSHYL